MLNRFSDHSDALRHQNFTDFDHQSLCVVCRLEVYPVQDKDQDPQCSHRVAVRLIEQSLRESLYFAL
jgi:hypothetical protein